MSRTFKIIPVIAFAAGLLPMAAFAGPVAGRLIAPVQQSSLSQGHLDATDPLAGQRQAATATQQNPVRAAQADSSRLSMGRFSSGDPLAGQRQVGSTTTAG